MKSFESADQFRGETERLRDHAPGVFRRVICDGDAWGDLFCEHTTVRITTLRQRVAGGRIAPAAVRMSGMMRSGMGLRRQAGEHASYSASGVIGPSKLDALAKDLRPITWPSANHAAKSDGSGVLTHDEPSDEAIGALVRDAADAALSFEPSIREVTVQLRQSTRQVFVLTSDGRNTIDTRSYLEVRVGVSTGAEQTGAYAIGGVAGENADMLDCRPERIAVEAVERARTLAEARRLLPGQMPVAIAGGWGGVWLHEAAGHLLEADVRASQPGAPPAALLGRRVAAEGVTLLDDATLPGGRGSYAFDDEAIAGQSTLLVEEGRIRGLLTDRYHAGRSGLAATGNGRRQDYRYPPMPRMTNLVLQAGAAAPEELIGEVKDGLFVAMIGNGRVLPEEDRFSFDVIQGYRIEAGRVGQPVTGVRIAGRASTVLNRITGIANDLAFDHARGVCVKHGQAVPVSTGMPTVLLSELDVEPAA